MTDLPVPTGRVVFQFLVPVHVEVEDGIVTCVTVIAAADDGQDWPSWQFGY
tara:strand:- start:8033 stop:8185 length:153 start_codon:yes stop_codon:yes gene_type:complete